MATACYDRKVNTRRWNDLTDEEYCYLTTTGRVTGAAHTIEIWFAAVGDTAYMLAGGGHDADWVRNLRANPLVSLRIADASYAGKARIVTDPDEAATARRLLYDKYSPGSNGDLATWRDTALPVAIDRGDAA